MTTQIVLGMDWGVKTYEPPVATPVVEKIATDVATKRPQDPCLVPAATMRSLEHLNLSPAQWSDPVAVMSAIKSVNGYLHLLDRQDREIEEAQLVAALDDQTRENASDLRGRVKGWIGAMAGQLSPLPLIEINGQCSVLVAQTGSRRSKMVNRQIAQIIRAISQRKIEMLKMLAEAGLIGRIRWDGLTFCTLTYPRVRVNDQLLHESQAILKSRRMTDRKTGKEITWAERAWNGRRVEETFSAEKTVEINSVLETHLHRLGNARRWAVHEAMRDVEMPDRVRQLLTTIVQTPLREYYEVVTGDMYDGTVREEDLGSTVQTVKQTWQNVWYACEPGVVHRPTGVVIAGWLPDEV